MRMNWKAYLLAGAVLAGVSGTAAARDHVNFSLSFGVPAPVYVAPPPAPVYYSPEPAYYAPPPAPAYYGPAYYSAGFYDRWGRWHPYRPHPRRYW
jgi:hypothetical protein